MSPKSAARLLALVALFIGREALAVPFGMVAQTYAVPFDVQDSFGNSHGSASYSDRSSGGVSASGGAISQSAKSTNFQVWAGYYHRIPTYTATATPTRTPSPSPTRTVTPSRTASPSPTFTRTITPSVTQTISPSPSFSSTPSPTLTVTPSATSSVTRSATPSVTPTLTITPSATATATATRTPFPALSFVKSANIAVVNQGDTISYTIVGTNAGGATATAFTLWDTVDISTSYIAGSAAPAPSSVLGNLLVWNFGTFGAGQSGTLTFAVVYSLTATAAVQNMVSGSCAETGQSDSNMVNIGFGTAFTPTNTITPSATPSFSATITVSPSFTATGTHTPSATPSATASATPSATATGTSTVTPTATASASPSSTSTATETPSSTQTPSSTGTPTETPSFTSTISPSPTGTFSATATRSSTSTRTATRTATPTVTPTASPTLTSTATVSSTVSPSPSSSITVSPSFTETPSATPTVSPTGSPTHTGTPSATASPTASPTFTPTASPTRTATVTVTPRSSSLSLVKVGPVTASQNAAISYSLIVTNAGPGDALNVTIDDTLPTELTFTGPGTLKGFNYPSNDSWRGLAGNLIAIGPFTIPVGQSLPLTVQAVVAPDAGGNTITNAASAIDLAFGTSGSGTHDTYIDFGVAADTATPTNTPNYTATNTQTVTPSVTPTMTCTSTRSPTGTGTRTVTGTVTRTATITASPTQTPTVTATPSRTPYAQLSVLKSADVSVVNVAGDRITYVLVVNNFGSTVANNVSVWDSVDPGTTFLAAAPVQSAYFGGVLSWTLPTLASGSSQSFTFSVSYDAVGQPVANQGAAAADLVAPVNSNRVDIGFGTAATFTSTQTPTPSSTISPTSTQTPTPTSTATFTPLDTASPSASPTSTPSLTATPSPSVTPSATPTSVLPPPVIALNIVKSQGDNFPNGFVPFRYRVQMSSPSGAFLSVPDLTIRFDSDVAIGADNSYAPMLPYNTLNGPASADVTSRWKQRGVDDLPGVETGTFALNPGDSGQTAFVYAGVDPLAAGSSITARATGYSAALNLTFTATLSTWILDVTATPTPNGLAVATSTPTPVASEGKIVAYPQPAKDNLCFAYHSPVGGKVSIILYNAGFEVVGKVQDTAVGGHMETSCMDISGMAPGVYLYKTKVGDYIFPMQQFGIAR